MDGFKKRLSESVQLRLSVTLSLAILLVALLASVFAFVSAFDEAHEQQDATLRQVAMLFDRQQMTLLYPQGKAIDGDDEESRVIIQHLGDGKHATGSSDEALPLPFPTTLADGLATVQVAGEAFRVLVHTTSKGERIAVAQEQDARDKDARESAWRSLLPFLILFPVLLLVVGDLVRKLFRPIGVLAAEIDQRDEQALHPIDEQHLPTEVRPFVVAINRLLARVGQSMDSQRRFVADAAHELRSPMTALSLQAERLAATDLSAVSRERFCRCPGVSSAGANSSINCWRWRRRKRRQRGCKRRCRCMAFIDRCWKTYCPWPSASRSISASKAPRTCRCGSTNWTCSPWSRT